MKDAIEGKQKLNSDIGTLFMLFLLVFPKTLMVLVFLFGYMWFVS